MTDSDPKLPNPTGAGAPPPDAVPPTPPTDAPPEMDATTQMPATEPGAGEGMSTTEPGAGEGMVDAPPTDAPPEMDATTQMPATEPGAGEGMPPVPPPDAPGGAEPLPEEEPPWYKKPGPIAALVVLVLAILGLIAWLVFAGGDDDDEATATSSRLILETTDVTGAVIDVGFIVNVVGPADAPSSFEWLRPDGVAPGEPAGATTGTDGRVDFEWQADETVAEPEAWLSTASAVVNVPAGWIPLGPVIDCVRDPLDGQQSVVSMNITLESPDTTVDRVAALTFPNYTFTPGDSVTCRLAAAAPPPTTSSTVVETTTPETTTPETTTPETTTPETTAPETTAPATTAPETTTPATTVPPTIPPPTVGQTAWDVIESNDLLSELEALVLAADPAVRELLEDETATITLFAPSNEAIEALEAADATSEEVTELLLAHVNDAEALFAADVLDLTEVPVMQGDPQPVDADEVTIGGAGVVQVDIEAENGVIHVIDAVLEIQS